MKTRAVRLFVTVSVCRIGNPEAVCFAVNFRSGTEQTVSSPRKFKVPQQPRIDPPSQIRCATSPIASGWRIPTKLTLGRKRQSVFLCGPMKLCVCGRWGGNSESDSSSAVVWKRRQNREIAKFCLPFGQSQSRVSIFLFQPIETHQSEQAIKSRKMRAPWAPDIRFPRLSGDTAVSVLLAVQLAK